MNTTHKNPIRTFGGFLTALTLLSVPLALQAQKGKTPPVKAMSNFKEAATVWKKVEAKVKLLHKTIDAKRWKSVHEAAFAVRDQVALLPSKSKGLSSDNQKKLAKGVGTVKKLASDLDEAGDGGKGAEVEALHKKLDIVLGAIKGLYPAGALK